jgi:apolipoprotein N-acyltransferase
LVAYPFYALVPAMLFAIAAAALHSRSAWFAAILWAVFVGYEIAAHIWCNERCDRLDLLAVYPLLGVVSLVAVIQLYVHRRDQLRRQQRRQRHRRRSRPQALPPAPAP